MAKKNLISLNVVTSEINGVFDKKDGNYIIIVGEEEYMLKDLENYFLGGNISISNSDVMKDGE